MLGPTPLSLVLDEPNVNGCRWDRFSVKIRCLSRSAVFRVASIYVAPLPLPATLQSSSCLVLNIPNYTPKVLGYHSVHLEVSEKWLWRVTVGLASGMIKCLCLCFCSTKTNPQARSFDFLTRDAFELLKYLICKYVIPNRSPTTSPLQVIDLTIIDTILTQGHCCLLEKKRCCYYVIHKSKQCTLICISTWPLLPPRTAVCATDSVCVDIDDQVDLSYFFKGEIFNHYTAASVISFS